MNARLWLLLAFLQFACIGRACAQGSTIIYRQPEHALTLNEIANGWDLDGDGLPDFSMRVDSFSLNIGECGFFAVRVLGLENNELRLDSGSVAVLPRGSMLNGDSVWGNEWEGTLLTTLVTCWDPATSSRGEDDWSGHFGAECTGYVGLRFRRADGWHYAWALLRALNVQRLLSVALPDGSYSEDVQILEWAYESQPDIGMAVGNRPLLPPPSSSPAIIVTTGTAALDLDLDERPDLIFAATNGGFSVHLLNGAKLAVTADHRLDGGVLIGPDTTFSLPTLSQINVRACSDCGCFGWTSPEGYLGVRLQRHGSIHYGWVQVAMPPDDQPGVFLLDWAWNPHPRRPILAGERVPKQPGKEARAFKERL